eukprot:TRINITY_DN7815_c0_g4_i1.p1 TRINITY_DN7815_c0_g4~~TRINITY_DN7815_c0_g4_i1.p1  ORF type:complete len:455 (+),score=40.40 TRINITY_DN7815_c0_g4_i1:183-1547(+)
MAADEQGFACRAFPALFSSCGDITPDHSHDVWAWNLSTDAAELTNLLKSTRQTRLVVKLDVVLPDSKVMRRSATSSFVDTACAYKDFQEWLYILRPLRLTLSIFQATSQGHLRLHGRWHFHMAFDLDADLHCKATVLALAASDFDFKRHAKEGISECMFRTWLVDSGLLGQDSVEWAASTKLLALAYLVKFVSRPQGLPEDHRDFNVILRALCPSVSLEPLPDDQSSQYVQLPARALEGSRLTSQYVEGTMSSSSSSRGTSQEATSVDLQLATSMGGARSSAPCGVTATSATSPTDDTRTTLSRHGSPCHVFTPPCTSTIPVAFGRKKREPVPDSAADTRQDIQECLHGCEESEGQGQGQSQHLAPAAKASPVGCDVLRATVRPTGAPPWADGTAANSTCQDPAKVNEGRIDENSLLEPSRATTCGTTLPARSLSTKAASSMQWKLHALAAMRR